MAAYPIPTAALDDRLGWVGTAGSGKTYNAGVGVERLFSAKARVIILDPLDVWWGLRLREDGKAPSVFAPVIFGGPHGDLPLNERSGALLGETCASMRESCIISLADFKSGAAERRFMLDFLTALDRNANREPVHLVFDEADLWAPQLILDKDGDAMKLLGQMQTIVRRGRVKGFIPWLITQRPAAISKGVLSQIDGMVAFKLTSSQDREAIGGWIKGQADADAGKAILASLPAMQQGQGVVWVPGRGVLVTEQFPAKATFDSSRTPKRGEVKRTATLKPLDLGALKDRLIAVEEEAKANDPKTLKVEIARLQAEARKASSAPGPAGPTPQAVEEMVQAAYRRGLSEGELKEWRRASDAAIARNQRAIEQLNRDLSEFAAFKDEAPPVVISSPSSEASKINTPAPKPRMAAPSQSPETRADGDAAPDFRLSGPGQRILDAVAWWKSAGIDAPSNEQVAFLAGYSNAGSGGYVNPRSALSAAGLIAYPAPNRVHLTAAGEALARGPHAAPSVSQLHERVMEKLNGPQRRILQPLIDAYPAAIANAELASAAGYTDPKSGGFVNPRSALSSISLITYPAPGYVRAADWLFPEMR